MKLPWARESPCRLRAPRSAVGIEAQTGWATNSCSEHQPGLFEQKKIQPLTQKLSAARNGGDKGEGWPRFYGFSLSTSTRWTFRPGCEWSLVFSCPWGFHSSPSPGNQHQEELPNTQGCGQEKKFRCRRCWLICELWTSECFAPLGPIPCFPTDVCVLDKDKQVSVAQ